MRSLLLPALLIFHYVLWGQQLGTGTYTTNGKVYNAIMIDYHGEISIFESNLREKFGKEFTRPTGAIGYVLEFRNASVPDWSDKKLLIYVWIQSRNNNHVISFSCKEKKGVDLLRSDSKSKPLIANYLRSSFK